MKKYILQKKCNLVGGRNLLNSPKPKHSLLFTAIFSFSVFNLQAQTSTKTLKLFAPPDGETTDSILVWHSDSTVRKISNSQISSIEPWNEATTTAKATGNTQNIYQNGKIGIGNFSVDTPATALDIENDTIAGAIKIVDGTQGEGKLLVSDSNGVGTWRTIGQTPVGSATLGTPAANAVVLNAGSFVYTGYNVSVHPGNSLVFAGFNIANPAG